MEVDKKKLILSFLLALSILAISLYLRSSIYEIKSIDAIDDTSIIGTKLTEVSNSNKSPDKKNFEGNKNSKINFEHLELIKEVLKKEIDLENFVSQLKDLGFEPEVANDSNDFTGDMSIVRLENPPKGMRYFHGQFFNSHNSDSNLQHLSFDLAGSNVPEVLGDLAQYLAPGKSPQLSREGYQMYRLNDDYILWGKLLSDEDMKKLKSDPYKAYEASDVGKLIRVAIEQEIH